MSNITLFNITNSFITLMNKAEEGELTEEEYCQLGEQLSLELQKKSSSIIGYIENEESLINAIDSQIKRLQELKKTKQNNINRFKEYVIKNMEQLDILKIETELGTLSLNKCPISVEIIDENLIPDEYFKIKKEPNKTAIKERFNETGEIIDGVKIINDKKTLKIK